MDNRIRIPWYRAKPKMTHNLSNGNGESPSLNLPYIPRIPKPRNRKRQRNRPQRQRVRERVRVPATATEPDPQRVPNRYPIIDPRKQLDPKQDPGTNPYREPGMNPVPVPRPSPNPSPNTRRDPGATPGVNQKQPMPQRPFSPGVAMNIDDIIEDIFTVPSPIPPVGYEFKGYSPKQQEWGNDFINNLELVSRVTAIESKRLYIFVRDFDYETGNLASFNALATEEFGSVAAVILSTGVAVKMLGQLWGKRLNAVAGSSFGTIKLDDDFMQEYFGTKTY